MSTIINPGIKFDLLELFADGSVPNKHFTGIVQHEGRQQPFTVWWKGRVVYFSTTRAEAEFQLKVEKARS